MATHTHTGVNGPPVVLAAGALVAPGARGHVYTAMELARAAGFLIRPVEAGGVHAIEVDGVRLLEVGPLASDAEICRHAAQYIELPAAVIMHVSHVCTAPVSWRM